MITHYCHKCRRPIRTKMELDGKGNTYHWYCLWGFLDRAIKKLERLSGGKNG